MFWSKKPKRADDDVQLSDEEQAVIVSFDTEENVDQIQKFVAKMTDSLEASLSDIGAEYDGDEYGENECNLYFYGPDAKQILNVIQPSLEKLRFRPIRIKLRFGGINNVSAGEENRRII